MDELNIKAVEDAIFELFKTDKETYTPIFGILWDNGPKVFIEIVEKHSVGSKISLFTLRPIARLEEISNKMAEFLIENFADNYLKYKHDLFKNLGRNFESYGKKGGYYHSDEYFIHKAEYAFLDFENKLNDTLKLLIKIKEE